MGGASPACRCQLALIGDHDKNDKNQNCDDHHNFDDSFHLELLSTPLGRLGVFYYKLKNSLQIKESNGKKDVSTEGFRSVSAQYL